jgi:hypothetical protein
MKMQSARSHWKGIIIAVLALGLLGFFIWLFLRPAQPARDLVFGDLGRRPATNNETTSARTGAVSPESSHPGNGQMATNIPQPTESPVMQNEQTPGRSTTNPPFAQPGQETAVSSLTNNAANNRSASAPSNVAQAQAPSNPPSAAFNPPPNSVSALGPRRRASSFEDNSLTPEPAHKSSTESLLVEAKKAGRGPDHPDPARTSDLLGNKSKSQRMFDAETGSNVVFILDNSMRMMTNGQSMIARQALAQAMESMSASQTFYVLLFHSGGYEGMPSLGPVAATPENIRAMTNWLFNAGLRSGSDPTKAVQRALGLVPAPDLVWLLSAGEISDGMVDSIREANFSANAHINTVGFYTRDGEAGLRRVANENRGTYRFVSPDSVLGP